MLVPALALFYGGMVRKKNVLAMPMQSFFAAGLLSVLWVLVGYTLAFTKGNPFFSGFSKALLMGIAPPQIPCRAPSPNTSSPCSR